MNMQLTASPEHEDLVQKLRIDMEENLEPELHPDERCIYRVLETLRGVNEEAYTPHMVSIGPLHHGNKGLDNIEKKKRYYMKSFLEKRITKEKQDDIFRFVKDKENEIRNCYSETSNLKSNEYIMMILYDAIFIIELFMRDKEGTSDSLLSTSTVRLTLTLDLELLENQLPYFILEGICKLASCSDMPSFTDISRSFFGSFGNMDLIELTPQSSVKHFTDWRRSTLRKKYLGSGQNNEKRDLIRTPQSSGKHFTDWISILWKKYLRSGQNNEHTLVLSCIQRLPCAMKLHESGVKFKKIEGGELIRFEAYRHELQLPQLQIFDELECVLRNVMALEQYHYPYYTDICNYIDLMDRLIENEKDVDLLVENGIISNFMGDNSSAANMFNKLCRNISVSQSSYYGMCEELKNHCKNPWNKTMAMLRRVYFSNLWRGTGTIVAVILLLLTVIQTICSILQVV